MPAASWDTAGKGATVAKLGFREQNWVCYFCFELKIISEGRQAGRHGLLAPFGLHVETCLMLVV